MNQLRSKYFALLFFLIYCITFFGQTTSAQKINGLYIELGFFSKIHCPTLTTKSIPINNQYFNLSEKKVVTPNGIFNLLPAINIGYEFKNKDQFNFGINADESTTGFNYNSMQALAGSGVPTNYPTGGEYSYGTLYTNFSLNFRRNIFLLNSKIHENHFVRGYLCVGVNYAYRPKYANFQDETGWQFNFADSTRVNFAAYVGSSGPINFKVAWKSMVGFGLDFGKGNKDYFSLNLGYSFSRYPVYGGILVKVDVTGKNVSEHYIKDCIGSGNAFYIKISKRIKPFRH